MREIIVKSILNRKKKRDSWFLDDYTLNPYEGCSFNCQYCYIRGSKYGENMAERLAVKMNGAEVLERQLTFREKKGQFGMIALASATDPYLPAEAQYRMTRRFLETIARHHFPVLMITKSEMILRDLDVLGDIDQRAIHAPDIRGKLTRGVTISFSLSTLDPAIAAALEPGAPPPMARLETMRRCKEAGFLVGVNCIPVLPFISDTTEALDRMIATATAYGADYILVGGLTLFGNQPADSKTLYHKFLERSFPGHIAHYRRMYRIFFSPPRAYLDDLDRRVALLCEKHGIRRGIAQ